MSDVKRAKAPSGYTRATTDPDKPYPIRMAVLSAGRQGQETYDSRYLNSKAPYKGGFYTEQLLKGLNESDSFQQAHDRFEQETWNNNHQEREASRALNNVKRTPAYKEADAGVHEAERKIDKTSEKYAPSLKSLQQRRAEAEKDKRLKDVAELDRQIAQVKEMQALDIKPEQDLRDNWSKKRDAITAPAQKRLDEASSKVGGEGGSRKPLPVSSEYQGIDGWKKSDKNPKTALLIKGSGHKAADTDLAAMKERLIKDYGLKESDIHVATNPDEVKAAMAKMEQFGKTNAAQNPAAMIYYSGHGFLDPKNETLKNPNATDAVSRSKSYNAVDRDDPEGMHRGTLQLAHPTDKTKDQMLHEHSLKDLIGTHFKNFDNRTLMILDTCFGGSFIAKNPASGQDNPFQSRNRGTVNV